MNHRATEKFWKLYDALPELVQAQADRSFQLVKRDPKHPSLHFKSVGRIWSARVDRQYRALAVLEGDTYVWFWNGNHDEYDRLLRQG